MKPSVEPVFDHQGGTTAPWYKGRELTEEQREAYRQTSLAAREAKLKALETGSQERVTRQPKIDPSVLMPPAVAHQLPALSLFSGGGGLDLGFERAGFQHVASYDTLAAAGRTLKLNRPAWRIYSGPDGDVRRMDWRKYRGELAVLHGGPPCQPFSTAGRQRGAADERNMLPEFVRAVDETRPLAFVAENVPALGGPKFAPYVAKHFLEPLSKRYEISRFRLSAHDFGVPQLRHRIFFVGFLRKKHSRRFEVPRATHRADHLGQPPPVHPGDEPLERTMGVREALGLPALGFDALAPTMRSTLTGPRHTTSILSSASAQRAWAALGVWPNGVARTRLMAQGFPAKHGHVRLAVADCALLQGFPSWWHFHGATYMALGQIGNSVAPPVGYAVARAVATALGFGGSSE